MIKPTILCLLLSGCSTGYVRDFQIEEPETRLCNVIKNIDNVLPIFALERDTERELEASIPNTPIEVAVNSDTTRNVVKLAETMEQKLIALRTMAYTNLLALNLAPCDKNHQENYWKSTNHLINLSYKIMRQDND